MESSPIYLSIPYILFLSTRNSQPRKRQQKYINIPEDKLDNQSYTFHIDIKITDSLRIHISSLFNDRLDHRHFTLECIDKFDKWQSSNVETGINE